MAQKCPICGEKMGFGNKAQLRDGLICRRCVRICGNFATASIDDIRQLWEENQKRRTMFTETNVLKGFGTEHVNIDDVHQLFFIGNLKKLKIEPIIFRFSEVEDYSYHEIGGKLVTKSKGGVGRAVVGGALFGVSGAIVGASTGKNEVKEVGGTTDIIIGLHPPAGRTTIALTHWPLGLAAFLDGCIEKREAQERETTQETSVSSADELMKWKSLLDQGIISSEEFEAKKGQLLGL